MANNLNIQPKNPSHPSAIKAATLPMIWKSHPKRPPPVNKTRIMKTIKIIHHILLAFNFIYEFIPCKSNTL
jgi:hypothetical protein